MYLKTDKTYYLILKRVLRPYLSLPLSLTHAHTHTLFTLNRFHRVTVGAVMVAFYSAEWGVTDFIKVAERKKVTTDMALEYRIGIVFTNV